MFLEGKVTSDQPVQIKSQFPKHCRSAEKSPEELTISGVLIASAAAIAVENQLMKCKKALDRVQKRRLPRRNTLSRYSYPRSWVIRCQQPEKQKSSNSLCTSLDFFRGNAHSGRWAIDGGRH
jgi:hypothetical protein